MGILQKPSHPDFVAIAFKCPIMIGQESGPSADSGPDSTSTYLFAGSWCDKLIFQENHSRETRVYRASKGIDQTDTTSFILAIVGPDGHLVASQNNSDEMARPFIYALVKAGEWNAASELAQKMSIKLLRRQLWRCRWDALKISLA